MERNTCGVANILIYNGCQPIQKSLLVTHNRLLDIDLWYKILWTNHNLTLGPFNWMKLETLGEVGKELSQWCLIMKGQLEFLLWERCIKDKHLGWVWVLVVKRYLSSSIGQFREWFIDVSYLFTIMNIHGSVLPFKNSHKWIGVIFSFRWRD